MPRCELFRQQLRLIDLVLIHHNLFSLRAQVHVYHQKWQLLLFWLGLLLTTAIMRMVKADTDFFCAIATGEVAVLHLALLATFHHAHHGLLHIPTGDRLGFTSCWLPPVNFGCECALPVLLGTDFFGFGEVVSINFLSGSGQVIQFLVLPAIVLLVACVHH